MKRFHVEFRRVWHEAGSAEVEADDAEMAREVAAEMLNGAGEIAWESDAMTTEEEYVEGVYEI